ncbi:PQQ-binding-like beta-propeller repeat protein [Halobacteria archaeon HArc-gm2]|nr:PQQ-binding-like beta-propeller repeat protein [Halobacteria archaeon HArc-gm2]
MTRTGAPIRRALPVVALTLLVVLSGCSFLGVDDPFGGPSTSGSAAFADVTANQSAALDRAGSFTLSVETTTRNGSRSVEETQTIRADRDAGVAASRIVRKVSGPNETTLTTDSFTTGDRTYLRHVDPERSSYSYEVHESDAVANWSAPSNLSAQFAFDHRRTDGGDHRFVVDSAEQIRSDDGVDQVENVSIRVRVDGDSGLITDLTYHLALSGTGGTTTYHTERSLTDVGSTAVSAPHWLDTAADRTGTNVSQAPASSEDDSSNPTQAEAAPESIEAIADPAALRGDVSVRRPVNFSVSRATSGNFETLEGGPYVHDGRVYALYTGLKKSGEDGEFYTALFAHDPTTMEPTWRHEFPADHSRVGEPAFENDTAYQITLENRGRDERNPYTLFAVDAADGTTRWERGLGEIHLRNDVDLAAGSAEVYTHGGLVYVLTVNSGPQKLLALDPETGETVWSTGGVIVDGGGVAFHGDRVFVGTERAGTSAAVALDAATGEVRWTRSFADRSAAFGVDHADSKGVYVAEAARGASTTLRSLRPDSGETRWEFDVEANYPTFLRSYPDADMVVVERRNQQLLGLDREDGTTLLSSPGNEPTRWNSQAGERNVYYGTTTKIEAVQPATFVADSAAGSWTIRRGGGTFGSGEIHRLQVVDGVVYATDGEGTMTAYAASDGRALYEQSLEYAIVDRVDAYRGVVYVGDRNMNAVYVLAPVAASDTTETEREPADGGGTVTAASSRTGPGFGVGVVLASLVALALLAGPRGRGGKK